MRNRAYYYLNILSIFCIKFGLLVNVNVKNMVYFYHVKKKHGLFLPCGCKKHGIFLPCNVKNMVKFYHVK